MHCDVRPRIANFVSGLVSGGPVDRRADWSYSGWPSVDRWYCTVTWIRLWSRALRRRHRTVDGVVWKSQMYCRLEERCQLLYFIHTSAFAFPHTGTKFYQAFPVCAAGKTLVPTALILSVERWPNGSTISRVTALPPVSSSWICTSVVTTIPSPLNRRSWSSMSLPSPKLSSSILSNPSPRYGALGSIWELSGRPKIRDDLLPTVGYRESRLVIPVLSKKRRNSGRRRGRLPHVIPMAISMYVQTPASTCETMEGNQVSCVCSYSNR